MKYRLLLASLCTAFLAAGCGKSDTTPTAAAPAPSATAPKAAAAGPTVIEVTAGDTMHFASGGKESGPAAGLTLEAKAGDVKIVFTNAGTQPKEVMGHNFVLLKPGSDVAAFAMTAMAAKATDYVPDALKDQVVAHTALLGPRKSEELDLKALAPGEYPFLCSFPAHFQVGMKGVLVVK